MHTIYDLYLMNKKKIPFKVKRDTWGKMFITVDHVEKLGLIDGMLCCEAITDTEQYKDWCYKTKLHNDKEMSIIEFGNTKSWVFADSELTEASLPLFVENKWREHQSVK